MNSAEMKGQPPFVKLSEEGLRDLLSTGWAIVGQLGMHNPQAQPWRSILQQFEAHLRALPSSANDRDGATAMTTPREAKLVPVEPTEEMLEAAWEWQTTEYTSDPLGPKHRFYAGIYRAMLATAPLANSREAVVEALTCPFCGEKDFDDYGLKLHLTHAGWCEPFEAITHGSLKSTTQEKT